MNDADYDAQVKRIAALHETWARPIGLSWWRIDYVYERAGIQQNDAQRQSGMLNIFEVTSDWRYMNAKIWCNMPAILDLPDDRLEQCFVHELMHIMVNEMVVPDQSPEALAHEERVCQTLANGFIWMRDHLRDNAKPAKMKSK